MYYPHIKIGQKLLDHTGEYREIVGHTSIICYLSLLSQELRAPILDILLKSFGEGILNCNVALVNYGDKIVAIPDTHITLNDLTKPLSN